MLVSKNPYGVEARQNPAPKNPHFALKTGEKFPQNLRLKSLIFIVEKYRKKCLCIKINTCFTLCGIYPYFWAECSTEPRICVFQMWLCCFKTFNAVWKCNKIHSFCVYNLP